MDQKHGEVWRRSESSFASVVSNSDILLFYDNVGQKCSQEFTFGATEAELRSIGIAMIFSAGCTLLSKKLTTIF